jgi:hypothetical protein
MAGPPEAATETVPGCPWVPGALSGRAWACDASVARASCRIPNEYRGHAGGSGKVPTTGSRPSRSTRSPRQCGKTLSMMLEYQGAFFSKPKKSALRGRRRGRERTHFTARSTDSSGILGGRAQVGLLKRDDDPIPPRGLPV